jgi:diguanylate cyclase (GGDEF)-like protein
MEQDIHGAVGPGPARAEADWHGGPTTARARNTWLVAIAATSLLAMATVIVSSLEGISLIVYASLYVPIVLAAYAFLWRGALFGYGLALAYLATMLAAFGTDPAVAASAVSRTVVFLATASVVAWLASGGRNAQRRIAVQRDLAFELDEAQTIDQAAWAAVRTLVSAPGIDMAIVFVSDDPDGDGNTKHRLAAHCGVSAAFVTHIADVDPASRQGAFFRSGDACWDTYVHLLAGWDIELDLIRAAEGLAGIGRLPIKDEGLTFGSLFVASRSQHFIRPTTQTIVELATAQVGSAMARIRAAQAMHRQHARTEILYEASRELTETMDYDAVLAQVARQAAQALDSDECHIWKYDTDNDSQVCVTSFAREPEKGRDLPEPGMTLRLGDYPSARAMMASNRPRELRIGDPAVPAEERELMVRLHNKTTLHVPLRHAGRPIGRLVLVETDRERHFVPDEVRLIQTLGEHAAAALENAGLFSSLEDQNRRLEALLESARVITSSMDLEKVLKETARRAAQAVGSPQCALYEYRVADESLFCRAVYQDPAADIQATVEPELAITAGGPYWRALHEQNTVAERAAETLDTTSRRLMAARRQTSVLGVPVVFSGTTIGLLTLIETARDRLFTPDDIHLVQALAGQAAIAINNARLFRTVEEQAVHDGLTGLYNHRYFYGRLSQEITRAHRYGEPVALLMLDIDDFKLVNDTYGHPVGDEVLRAIGQVMRTQARRDVDLAARYGGEEFALLLPNTPVAPGKISALPGRARSAAQAQWASRNATGRRPDQQYAAPGDTFGDQHDEGYGPLPLRPDGAMAIAERIRAMVAASTYAVDVVPGGVRVTVSIGIAGWDEDPSFGAGDLVDRADQSLYAAKGAGKDRCVVYGADPAPDRAAQRFPSSFG